MQKIILNTVTLLALVFSTTAMADDGQLVGTAVGAGVGGAVGNIATRGSAAGTAAGVVVGGAIGNVISQPNYQQVASSRGGSAYYGNNQGYPYDMFSSYRGSGYDRPMRPWAGLPQQGYGESNYVAPP